MYDKDGTKVMVYNVEKWPKKGIEKPRAKKIKKYITKRRTLDSRLDYSSYAEDGFYISFSYFFFQSTHDRYFLSRISFSHALQIHCLALLGQNSILFRVQVKTGPYMYLETTILYIYNFKL